MIEGEGFVGRRGGLWWWRKMSVESEYDQNVSYKCRELSGIR